MPLRVAQLHLAISNLKTWLRGTFHGVSPKHLQRYLDEFSYRFDRPWREGELFGFVLRRVRGQQRWGLRISVYAAPSGASRR